MTEYLYPASIEETIVRLDEAAGAARIIAGGTDLMLEMRHKIAPRYLLDITRIPGLDQIAITGEYLQVGAAVTFARIREHQLINGQVHALADAARSVGAIGIQTAATWVGNIVQAMPAADGAIVALALEAEARVMGLGGDEWRPVESLFLGPGRSAVDPTRQFLTHIRFPLPAGGTAWGRIGRRESLVLPILNCAVKLDLLGGRIERLAVALGPVDLRPFRARGAEGFLRGKEVTAELLTEAGRIARDESNPRSSIMRASRDYRLAVIPSLVTEALATAAERANNRIEKGERNDSTE
jgi:carbon-monoxide dehydrogenase medium subunit